MTGSEQIRWGRGGETESSDRRGGRASRLCLCCPGGVKPTALRVWLLALSLTSSGSPVLQGVSVLRLSGRAAASCSVLWPPHVRLPGHQPAVVTLVASSWMLGMVPLGAVTYTFWREPTVVILWVHQLQSETAKSNGRPAGPHHLHSHRWPSCPSSPVSYECPVKRAASNCANSVKWEVSAALEFVWEQFRNKKEKHLQMPLRNLQCFPYQEAIQIHCHDSGPRRAVCFQGSSPVCLSPFRSVTVSPKQMRLYPVPLVTPTEPGLPALTP